MRVAHASRPLNLLVANLETAAPPLVTRGSPIGAPVALWREPGCRDSRDAVVVECLQRQRLGPDSKHRDTDAAAKGIVTSAAA
jgi:hypothetical protein